MNNDLIKLWLIRLGGNEGGYSNRDPIADPGGETKWGICKRSYPNLDIANLTVEQATEIYIKDFINPLAKTNIPRGVAYQLFDFSVNSGLQKAIEKLQIELNVKSDGVIGDKTITALNKVTDSDLVMLIVAARLEYLADLNNWKYNSRGWAKRIAKCLRYGAEDTD